MKQVSIVILNWNGCKMLQTFLPSVVKYSLSDDVEICVADNVADYNSIYILLNDFPMVRLLYLHKIYGFAVGYQRALLAVDAEFVVLFISIM